MIVTIAGVLKEVNPLLVVIDIQGLGYAVNIPLTTMEKLPPPGSEVKLFTLVVYREDSQTLYGFYSKEDRELFRLLVEKVSGIGPRIALTIMSKLSVTMLKNAIAASDVALLAKCPGIGKKTAERLVIELRDKILPAEAQTPSRPASSAAIPPLVGNTRFQDAVTALIALGYKAPEADKAVRRALTQVDEEAPTEEIIKKALN